MTDKQWLELETAVKESMFETFPKTGDTSDDMWHLTAEIASIAAVTAIRLYLKKNNDL